MSAPTKIRKNDRLEYSLDSIRFDKCKK